MNYYLFKDEMGFFCIKAFNLLTAQRYKNEYNGGSNIKYVRNLGEDKSDYICLNER